MTANGASSVLTFSNVLQRSLSVSVTAADAGASTYSLSAAYVGCPLSLWVPVQENVLAAQYAQFSRRSAWHFLFVWALPTPLTCFLLSLVVPPSKCQSFHPPRYDFFTVNTSAVACALFLTVARGGSAVGAADIAAVIVSTSVASPTVDACNRHGRVGRAGNRTKQERIRE